MLRVLAFGAALALAAGGAQATVLTNAITSNGFNLNALSPNALTANAITNNAITNNAITNNAVTSNALDIGTAFGDARVVAVELPAGTK